MHARSHKWRMPMYIEEAQLTMNHETKKLGKSSRM